MEMYCNGGMNKCAYDPFIAVQGKTTGQSCEMNFMCLNNNCAGGVCLGADEGDQCSNNYDCNSGLYCDKSLRICSS